MYSSRKNNLTACSIVEILLVLVLSTQTWCFPINSSEEIYAKISPRQQRKLNDFFLNTDQFKCNNYIDESGTVLVARDLVRYPCIIAWDVETWRKRAAHLTVIDEVVCNRRRLPEFTRSRFTL